MPRTGLPLIHGERHCRFGMQFRSDVVQQSPFTSPRNKSTMWTPSRCGADRTSHTATTHPPTVDRTSPYGLVGPHLCWRCSTAAHPLGRTNLAGSHAKRSFANTRTRPSAARDHRHGCANGCRRTHGHIMHSADHERLIRVQTNTLEACCMHKAVAWQCNVWFMANISGLANSSDSVFDPSEEHICSVRAHLAQAVGMERIGEQRVDARVTCLKRVGMPWVMNGLARQAGGLHDAIACAGTVYA